jgi:hypothetical protein
VDPRGLPAHHRSQVTDSTPTPHDAEYREQRKFEALLQTATNGQLREMLRKPDERTTWELAAVHAELSRRKL